MAKGTAPADLLVKLYELEDDWSFLQRQSKLGITIRKPIGPEKRPLIDWVAKTFNPVWASEMDVALSNRPLTAFIAVLDGQFIGFACYDATALGFFGPLGVAEPHRRNGTGRALCLSCLLDMKLAGYGYGIFGMAGPDLWPYYNRVCGAVEIPGSDQSVWKTWVKTAGAR